MATIPLTDNGLKRIIADANKAVLSGKKAKTSISDGGGLTLMRQDSGTWIWFYRYYRFDGKRTRMSLGGYPEVTLAMVREEHRIAKEQLRTGIDPIQHREEQRAKRKIDTVNSFEAVMRQWFEVWRVDKDKDYARKTLNERIEKYLLPAFGKKPITSLMRPELVLPSLQAVGENGAPVVARRLFGTCNKIFEYAYMHGLTDRNPLAGIKIGVVLKGQKTINHPRVSLEELPDLLSAIDSYEGKLVRLGLQLMTLVFVRHSELIGARWEDFDFTKNLWTIPGRVEDDEGNKIYGMKMNTVHYVPLSQQALAILELLHEISGKRKHLFPSTKGDGKTMSVATMNKALENMGYKGKQDVHGFRGLASTLLHEYDRKVN